MIDYTQRNFQPSWEGSGTVGDSLKWYEKYPLRPVTYMSADRFGTISRGNISSYTVIGRDQDFVYTLIPSGIVGHVFAVADLENTTKYGVPKVVTISLEKSGPVGLMQAILVCVRLDYARRRIPSRWRGFYEEGVGHLAPDFKLLDEGNVVRWTDLPAMGE